MLVSGLLLERALYYPEGKVADAGRPAIRMNCQSALRPWSTIGTGFRTAGSKHLPRWPS